MKIVFITVSTAALKSLIAAQKDIDLKYPVAMELKLYYAVSEFSKTKEESMIHNISQGDLVFVDLMGAPPTLCEAVNKGLTQCKGNIVPFGNSAREFLRLGKFTSEGMKSNSEKAPSAEAMKKMKTMAETMGKFMPGKIRDMKNYMHMNKYFSIATYTNIYNMLLLMLSEYGKVKIQEKIEAPMESKGVSLFNANTREQCSLEKYLKYFPYDPNKATVAIICSANTYPTDTSQCVYQIHKKLEGFANVMTISVVGDFSENKPALEKLLVEGFGKKVELLVNVTPFRLGAGPMGGDFNSAVEMLKDLDIPYLHPFFMTRVAEKTWEESVRGCTPSEVLISVMLPELDGAIDSIPVGAMSEGVFHEEHSIITEELQIIEERVQRLVNRIKNHLALRSKENHEKKVAIICYNYPPGEANLFGGAFLDTFASVEGIMETLNKSGYDVDSISKEQLMEIFTAGKAVNSGKYDMNWDEILRYSTKKYKGDEEASQYWGKPPGEIMSDENDFLIPGAVFGKVFVGLQPSRGIVETEDTTYHDKTIPPHHQYIAFYQWLHEEFKADAIVHVGTHGTLEFLKGKECGMSGKCYPEKLIADTPHVYLYYAGNPSEAIIAKRRSLANLVSYQPPVFVHGELYGEYLELSTEIDHYRQALSLSQSSAEEVLEYIQRKAKDLGLPKELEKLEDELYRMNSSLIPKGLHIFGEKYTEEEVDSYLQGLKKVLDPEDSKFYETLEKARDNANQNYEKEGLIKALAGRFNEAKLAGDIYRNVDVLPTGGNLYQFDPRLIPTAVAMERGKRICEDTINFYKENQGVYPQSTAVIMWGLDVSRTQGETFAQILGYLGVKIKKSGGGWDTKFHIIPIAELGRPRIDVTVNICGFFRDMFPNLVEDLSDLFERLYELDESDEENYFKAHSRRHYKSLLMEGYDEEEAKQLAVSRIFGPREGEYGTNLTGIIETKNWQEEAQFGESFVASLKHVYSRRMHGKSVDGLYRDNLKAVDIVSQIRSSNEYEITDLDHYYEFFGGLSKAVEGAKGKKAQMLITDTTGKKPQTETVDKAIGRGVRTRILNPKWIDGMLSHKYHGGQKISERFENIMGLSATTNSVDPWIYDDLHSCYVEDEQMRKRMIENNSYAYMEILQQMMEYSSRGYWEATDKQLNLIKDIYLELEDNIEETVK